MMLFEMDWYERSPLTSVLRRNRGRWVHFSRGAPNRAWQDATLLPEPQQPTYYDPRTHKKYQRDLTAVRRKNAIAPVPKMGINPKSMWQDPKGLYFYPVDFVLSGAERILSGNQYGLDYPWYYIADLKLNDPNGINLGTMTWQDVEAIAKRNGWFDPMQAFRQLPPDEQKAKLFSYSRPDLPGSFFWHFIDRMVKDGKMTWTRAYKGVSYIRDPNLSIIHSNEPDQVLVLDPRLVKVIEMGENKTPMKAAGDDNIEQWMHALLSIIKQVRGEYGGDLAWMKKKPTLSFTKGVGQFTLSIPERSGRMDIGLTLNYTYGRARNSMYVSHKDLREQSSEQIVQSLHTKIEQVAARKTDLLFTPIISIEAGKRLMMTQMTDKLGLSINTSIDNAESPEYRRYNGVTLHGVTQREIDHVLLKTTCFLRLTEQNFSGSCNVWAGKHYLISASSDYQQDFTDPSAMFANIAAKTRENLDGMVRSFAPGSTRQSHPRFGSTDEVTAFMGWLILNSGLTLGDELHKQFAPEIAAFEAYPEKRVLLSDIAYVLNNRW